MRTLSGSRAGTSNAKAFSGVIDYSEWVSKAFLIIGRAGMDLYPEPAGTSIEQALSYRTALGGSSANIGVALVRQGAKASLVTCVSDDAIGRFCLNQLDAFGIDRQHVRSVAGEFRNSLALSESRLQDHQTVIYRNGAADFQMNLDDVSSINYEQHAALITTGTVLASEPSRSATLHAFTLARKAGIALIFDVDYRPYSWASAEEASAAYSQAAKECDIIIGNDTEFGFMAGDYDKGLAKARELAAEGASIVIYKMGEQGSITITPDTEFRTGVFAVDALKPVGAGDSFMGGFIASLTGGYDLPTAVLRGSACAAMVVTRVGCSPAMPTVEELDAFLANHSIIES